MPALSFTILAGAPGTGKTTLAQQILFHLGTPGRPALYFSILGEPTFKLLRYQQQFAFFEPARVGRDVFFFDLADEVRRGGIGRVREVITREVEQRSPMIVAIDSFRAVQELAEVGGISGLRTFVHDLALILASWDTTSLLISEYREVDYETDPEFTICDGILWLSQQARQNSVTRKLQAVKLRGLAALPGRHTFRITDDGLHIYPRLSNVEPTAAALPEGRCAFGVPGLDEMMRGGIPQGEACLIAGSSGTGKTLMALHFIVEGARQGEPGVMITFEEQPQAHVRKAQRFGWDLPALEAQDLLRMIYLRPVDLSVDEVLSEIQRAVEALGAW
ncbi:MAG: AAA family ATPase [Chloroflexi bacterium]|nr:AAA family ATPase [Chloroflexota bacterium]